MGGAAVFAAALVFLATQSPGPGLDPDSMAYTGAATSLVEHGTLRVPTGEWDRADSTSALSLWPPGYPAAIAVPMQLGLSAVQSGRWINVVAAGVTALAVGALVASVVGTGGGLVAVLVVFATQAVFDVHLSVLSEPLFIALMLLTLTAMVLARDRLWLLAILATATVMVRYAGAAAPAAVVCWTLLDSRYDVRRRLRRAIAVAVLPAVALIAWFVRTALRPDRHATPDLAVYGNWGAALSQARDTVGAWLVPVLPPGTLRRVIAIAVIVVLVVFVIAAARDASNGRGGSRMSSRTSARAGTRTRSRTAASMPHTELLPVLIGAAMLLGAWYLIVLIASRAFVGGTIPFDWRILAPLIVLLEVMAVASIAHWWHAYHRPLHVAIGLVAAVWLVAAGAVTFNDAQWAATEGSDFAASEWRNSPLVAWVRANGRGHPLYSNWPPALYFHAHRIARELPDSTAVADLPDFANAVRKGHGYIVAFDAPSPDVIPPDSLATLLHLQRVARTSDGTVWQAPDTTSVMPVTPPVTPPAAAPVTPRASSPTTHMTRPAPDTSAPATPAGGAPSPR